MAMIEVVEDFAGQNILEQFEVDDKAGDGVDFSGDGNLKGVVVAVPVEVGTLAEDTLVLLRSPLRFVIVVRGRELSPAGEINQCGSLVWDGIILRLL
jgi:hypothetical protein